MYPDFAPNGEFEVCLLVQRDYPGHLIAFINSDILLNPKAIKVALSMSQSLSPGKVCDE